MGRRLVWPAIVVGAVLALLGGAVMVVLGPDSRFTTGPHEVETDGVAVVTAPGVISYRGLRVDVLVEVPVNKPVFVGLGNTVDVEDYLGRTQRLEVTSFQVPWTVRTAERDGRAALPGAPTALDWWIADSAGLGGASISTTLPDESVSLAILSVGASDLSGLRVTFAYGVQGGFGTGLGVLLLGLGLVWVGLLLRRGGFVPVLAEVPDVHAREERVEEVEEVVYVFVDERGVEHEVSAEEAARLQAELAAAEPAGPAAQDDGRTSTDEEGESAATTPADVGAGGAAPPPPPVVYVFVDEDGVEHEVSEDELADYEVVDEEEPR